MAEQGGFVRRRPRTYFSTDEDALLLHAVQIFGQNNWKSVARLVPGKTVRQCRERFRSHLSRLVSRNPFASDEDELLLQLVAQYGPKWSQFAPSFRSRSPAALKARFRLINDRGCNCLP
jgi:hypothetical protein